MLFRSTLTTTAGGLTIRRGDRWTVRLNLLGFDSRRLEEFLGVLRSSSCLSAARHAKSTAGYMRDRLAAVGKGSETKKFVNIAAGRKACQGVGAGASPPLEPFPSPPVEPLPPAPHAAPRETCEGGARSAGHQRRGGAGGWGRESTVG